jgi:hypothetical protein
MKRFVALLLAICCAANCRAGDLRKLGSTSQIARVRFTNSSTGNGLAGLTSASSGLIISTIADNEATATSYTVAGSTIESIATLGAFVTPTATKCRFKEVDATNQPGVYELQIADARFAVSSAKRLVISWTGAANLKDDSYEIQLTSFDPYDSVRGGFTSLPSAVPGAAGGLFIAGSNAATTVNFTGSLSGSVGSINAITFPTHFSGLSIDGSGRIDVGKILGRDQTANDVGGALPNAAYGTAGGIQRYKF